MPKHLQREISKLKKQILSLGAMVEENLRRSVSAVEKHDLELASKAIQMDDEIDDREIDVEEECLKILALHQPVAVDLRFIVAVLKINNDLERIGDLTVNIAERANFLAQREKIGIPFNFAEMSEKVQQMLKSSLDALVNLDAVLARKVLAADDQVDNINREMYNQVESEILAHSEHLDSLIHLLTVSRNLERIGDHATNIAEDVIYMIEGDIVRHGRTPHLVV